MQNAKTPTQRAHFSRNALLIQVFPELGHIIGVDAEHVDRLQLLEIAVLRALVRTRTLERIALPLESDATPDDAVNAWSSKLNPFALTSTASFRRNFPNNCSVRLRSFRTTAKKRTTVCSSESDASSSFVPVTVFPTNISSGFSIWRDRTSCARRSRQFPPSPDASAWRKCSRSSPR